MVLPETFLEGLDFPSYVADFEDLDFVIEDKRPRFGEQLRVRIIVYRNWVKIFDGWTDRMYGESTQFLVSRVYYKLIDGRRNRKGLYDRPYAEPDS